MLRATRKIDLHEEIVFEKGKSYYSHLKLFLRQPLRVQTEIKQYYNFADGDFKKVVNMGKILCPPGGPEKIGSRVEESPPTPANNTRSQRGVAKPVPKK